MAQGAFQLLCPKPKKNPDRHLLAAVDFRCPRTTRFGLNKTSVALPKERKSTLAGTEQRDMVMREQGDFGEREEWSE